MTVHDIIVGVLLGGPLVWLGEGVLWLLTLGRYQHRFTFLGFARASRGAHRPVWRLASLGLTLVGVGVVVVSVVLFATLFGGIPPVHEWRAALHDR